MHQAGDPLPAAHAGAADTGGAPDARPPSRTTTEGPNPCTTKPERTSGSRDEPSSRSQFLKIAGGTGAAGALALFIAACGGDDDKS